MNFDTILMSFGIVCVLLVLGAFIVWRIREKADFERCLDMVFLRLRVPINDSKDDKEKSSESIGSTATFREALDVGTDFFNALYSIYSGDFKNKFIGEDFFSLEIVLMKKELYFYFVVPRSLQHVVEKQLTSFYSDAYLEPVEDYNFFKAGHFIVGNYLTFSKDSMFPIKTYKNIGSDPMNGLINVMSKFESEDGAAVQIVLRPAAGGWQEKGRSHAKNSSSGTESKSWTRFLNPWNWIVGFFTILTSETAIGNNSQEGSKNTQLVDERIKLMEEKNTRHGFEATIRVISSSPDKEAAENNLSAIRSAFSVFDELDGNGFSKTEHHTDSHLIKNFVLRSMEKNWWYNVLRPKTILTSEEITSLFHTPNIKYNKAPIINWDSFKIAPPPAELPDEGVLLGKSVYRGVEKDVRILRGDRRRHFYLIGKSGTGKSTLLETLIQQDLENGEGMCVIDPHGDLVEAMLQYVPKSRADDVIYFNPGDLDRPMGLNICEAYTDDQKEFMSQEALAIFIKMFGEEIMGPRLQHYFRNGLLTLMADDDEGATLLDIPRLFTDDAFAAHKQKKVTNAAVRQFWDKEMANTGEREKQEMIPYFSSKFGPFVSNLQIRNIIGQPKSGFDFRDVMDNQKILFVNLSKGKLGDLNAKLLGMIMVSKIQMAAMGRVDTPEDERKDFYLYVDEFQNFVTESFASILSEARKYRLNLIVAHQYISQITKMSGGGKGSQEDTTIRDAVFGNVGSMMCFKIGAADSETMAKEFAPVFSDQDLVNIANYQAYIKLNINNTTSRAFSMKTIYNPSGKDPAAAKAFIQLSRLKFARDRKFVDKEIARRLS